MKLEQVYLARSRNQLAGGGAQHSRRLMGGRVETNMEVYMVDSYKLKPNVGLVAFLKTRQKEPEKKMSMTVYKSWLKKYLDWFNPDLFDSLQAHSNGVKVVLCLLIDLRLMMPLNITFRVGW
jgi:hypothetical protein